MIFDFEYYHGNSPEAKRRRLTKELYLQMDAEAKLYFSIYALERIPYIDDDDLRDWYYSQLEEGNLINIVDAMIEGFIIPFINSHDRMHHGDRREVGMYEEMANKKAV